MQFLVPLHREKSPVFFFWIMLELLSLIILWELAKFIWTGEIKFSIMNGQETQVLSISKGVPHGNGQGDRQEGSKEGLKKASQKISKEK